MTLASIDRGIFTTLNKALIKLGITLDRTSYATIKEYDDAKKTEGTSKKLVEIFGCGSFNSRIEKTDSKIIIDRDSITVSNSLSYASSTMYVKNTDGVSYSKYLMPKACYNILYDIRIICTETKLERILTDVLLNNLNTKNYLKGVKEDGTETEEYFFISFMGSADISDNNFIEKMFKYEVSNVLLTEPILLDSNIPQASVIGNNLKTI